MDENLNLAGNTEIEKALKEFEVKNPEQAQKAIEITSAVPKKEAGDITFDTDSYKAVKFYSETDTPKVVKLVMKWSGGAIKEERQAEYVLVGFIVLAIGISLFLIFNPLSGGNYPKLDSTAFNKLMQTPPAEIPSIKN